MKKGAILLFVGLMLFQLFPVAGFAADSAWKIETDRQVYKPGDFIKLSIINTVELEHKFQGGRIYFTFNSTVLEFADGNDDAFYHAAGGAPVTSSGLGTAAELLTVPGVFRSGMAAANPVRVGQNATVYTVYFKVKEAVTGIHQLNFQWMLNGPYFSYVGWWDDQNQSHVYDIDFVDCAVKVQGAPGVEPTQISAPSVFTSKNSPSAQNPLKVFAGRSEVEITTPYGVVFTKIPAKNNASMKHAGVLLSREPLAEELFYLANKISKNLFDAEAVNYTSKNEFGILFFGAGIQLGHIYFIRPYVTYDDNTVLYGPVSSFQVLE